MAQLSAVDDVITALLSTLDTALSVPVYDGEEVTSSSETDFVLVGSDGDPEGDGISAEVTQDLAAFEYGTRDEEGIVTCAVIAQSGTGDLAPLRTSSKTTMVAVEAALRTSDNLSGVVASGWIDSVRIFQARNTAGAVVRRVWTYRYRYLQ